MTNNCSHRTRGAIVLCLATLAGCGSAPNSPAAAAPVVEADSEFLTSSDNWFRPVEARTGPDGALWIVDMYRYVIEHSRWIPQNLQDELDVLIRMSQTFTEFARLPAPHLQECDPRAVAAGALSLYQPRIAESGVRATLDDREAPASMRADPEQLGRALKNVIQNALDAMDGAAGAALEIAVLGDGAGKTVFRVRDTGPGFPPEVLGRAFEPYVTTRRDRGGTGLGLAIARRIVSEHGGSITAGNVAGGGAVITITV